MPSRPPATYLDLLVKDVRQMIDSYVHFRPMLLKTTQYKRWKATQVRVSSIDTTTGERVPYYIPLVGKHSCGHWNCSVTPRKMRSRAPHPCFWCAPTWLTVSRFWSRGQIKFHPFHSFPHPLTRCRFKLLSLLNTSAATAVLSCNSFKSRRRARTVAVTLPRVPTTRTPNYAQRKAFSGSTVPFHRYLPELRLFHR
jgi:hypothetical protein